VHAAGQQLLLLLLHHWQSCRDSSWHRTHELEYLMCTLLMQLRLLRGSE
jgi:hypothetical protein